MFKFIKDLNVKYDKMNEPWRFLTFIIPLMLAVYMVTSVPFLAWLGLLLLTAFFIFRVIGKYC